jgi:hypothetical protein
LMSTPCVDEGIELVMGVFSAEWMSRAVIGACAALGWVGSCRLRQACSIGRYHLTLARRR